MGLFDGILGGVIGAEMTNIVSHVIEQHGGVSGMMAELQAKGLGDAAKSWVGMGANDPMTASQVHDVLGSDKVADLAAKFGLSPDDLAAKLSQILPQAMDKLTPNGVVPPA
jgi:uncharacterized protein YidB (DUF937 family)